MLVSLKVKNCLVFEDETELTLQANLHGKRLASNLLRQSGMSIVKSVVVFGPNNTGKTNLVRIVDMLRHILLNKDFKPQKNMFSRNSVCELTVDFIYGGEMYRFAFAYDTAKGEYIRERFECLRNSGGKDVWLMRDSLHAKSIAKDKNLEKAMSFAGKNNLLVFNLDTSQFPLLNKIKEILTGFASSIDVIDMNNIPIDKTLEILKATDERRHQIYNFIKNADLSLENFEYVSDERLPIKLELEGNAPQEAAMKIPGRIIDLCHLVSTYKGIPVPSIIYDSTGTKKLAALAGYVLDALEKGRILVVDELDNSLHFKMTRAIIALFNNELNTKGQLIATAHDISLLDIQTLFRKEQIWFTHKDEKRVYLYSLADFTAKNDGIRENSDLLGKYRSGALGALPEPKLFESLLEVLKQ